MTPIRLKFTRFLFLSIIISVLSSCTPKNVSYLQDINTETLQINALEQAIKIEPSDKVSIIVKSKDPNLSELFNLPVISSRVGISANYNGATGNNVRTDTYGADGITFYTVTPEGTIDFPVLGKIHIAGMTRSELAGFIKGELMGRNLIKDPIVLVEFMNTGISIIGEVKEPGRYDINKDNINILEAIALAGDLDIQGNRENVLVMREENGQMKNYRIDLTKGKELVNSPAFYLKQNDIIYVEPNGVKKRQTTVNGNTALQASFWVSVASLLTSVAVLIFK